MRLNLHGARGRVASLLAMLMTAALLAVPAPRAAAAHDPRPTPKRSALRVGQPVSYKNLTLFPVLRTGAAPADDAGAYITLDEGIRAGTVRITERGAVQVVRGRRGRPVNQRTSLRDGDGASVNELALVNRSGKKLMLLAGEVIVGGKQDRIVQDDLVVPPVSTPISLSVFCVEHGRWSPQAEAPSPRATAHPVIAPQREAARADGSFYSLGAVAHPTLRAAAQDKGEQAEVWREVGENNRKLGTSNGTDTYQEVYASGKVAKSVESYVRTLQRELTGPNVVGVVVARNGELVWSDVFASASLFSRYWPKLLKSYAVEALADQTSERRPSVDEAARYLFERDGVTKTSGRPGVYELVRVENPSYAVFELWDASLAAPLRLHFNKAQR